MLIRLKEVFCTASFPRYLLPAFPLGFGVWMPLCSLAKCHLFHQTKQWLVLAYYLRDGKWFQHPDGFWSGGAASYFCSLLSCKTFWLLGALPPRGSGDGFNSWFAAEVHRDSSEPKLCFSLLNGALSH